MSVRKISARTSPVRCAYCHDSLDAAVRGCTTCRTVLHEDCWVLAGECPTLACGVRQRVKVVLEVVRELPRGASFAHLAFALVGLLVVWLVLFFVTPAFDKMRMDMGWYHENTLGDVVFGASRQFEVGVVVGLGALVGSVVLYWKKRKSARVRIFFLVVAWLSGLSLPVFVVTLFQSLCCGCLSHRL